MLLLALSLPSSAFANFDGIVYNIPDNLSNNQLDVDSQVLSHITNTVKLYDNLYMEQTVNEFSQKGVDVYIGINITGDDYKDRLDKYIKIAKNYPNVLSIILESDPIDKLNESQIIEIVRYVKEKGVKTSVASTPDNWNKMEKVLEEIDFPYYYVFDYWNGYSASQALVKLQKLHQENLQAHSMQPIYEIGYPDGGNVIGNAHPSSVEQKKFIDGLSEFDGSYILFSYSNEKQKFKSGSPENTAEQNFGLIKDGKIKYSFSNIVHKMPLQVNTQKTPDDMVFEYVPTLTQDKSKPESIQEVMGIKISSKQGNVDIYYDDEKRHFEIIEPLTIFLDLGNYESVKVLGDSIDSISFFSVPAVFAQCGIDFSTCVYLKGANDYDHLEYVISASLVMAFASYILMKFKLLSNLKFRKMNVGNKNESEYFERMSMP